MDAPLYRPGRRLWLITVTLAENQAEGRPKAAVKQQSTRRASDTRRTRPSS